MNVIKAKSWDDVPNHFTGIIEWESGNKGWYKNGNSHREDGPVWIRKDGYRIWYLDGFYIWNSTSKRDLTNQIILSKTKHPNYPTVQIWKILDKDKVYEQIVIPGMEEFIKE